MHNLKIKDMNNAFKALLAVAAIVLAWLCYNSITTPIKFSEEKERREKAIIQRLSDIRKAEVEYRNLKGDYTDSFDTLMNFIKNEKSAIILKEGELTDKQLEEGMTEKEAVKLGLIKRDTTYVSMQVALFGENYNVDSLCYIPYSETYPDGIQMFDLEKGEVTTGSAGIKVKVMEARAPYVKYLSDLNRQELTNLVVTQEKMERFPGLKFGDVNESNNNAGNWE